MKDLIKSFGGLISEHWLIIVVLIAGIAFLGWLIHKLKKKSKEESENDSQISIKEDESLDEDPGDGQPDSIDLEGWNVLPVCAHCNETMHKILVIWGDESNEGNFSEDEINIAMCPHCHKPVPVFVS